MTEMLINGALWLAATAVRWTTPLAAASPNESVDFRREPLASYGASLVPLPELPPSYEVMPSTVADDDSRSAAADRPNGRAVSESPHAVGAVDAAVALMAEQINAANPATPGSANRSAPLLPLVSIGAAGAAFDDKLRLLTAPAASRHAASTAAEQTVDLFSGF